MRQVDSKLLGISCETPDLKQIILSWVYPLSALQQISKMKKKFRFVKKVLEKILTAGLLLVKVQTKKFTLGKVSVKSKKILNLEI